MKCHGNFYPMVSVFFLSLPLSQNSALGKGNLSITVGAKQSCRGGLGAGNFSFAWFSPEIVFTDVSFPMYFLIYGMGIINLPEYIRQIA